MEVLLLQDVAQVGKRNDLLIVGNGLALNFLLPKRLAIVATPTVRKRYAEEIKRRAQEREQERRAQADTLSLLHGKVVTFNRKATKTGKLYAAISPEAIAKALKEQHGSDVPASAIRTREPIKALGTFSIELRLAEQIVPLSITVEEHPSTGSGWAR